MQDARGAPFRFQAVVRRASSRQLPRLFKLPAPLRLALLLALWLTCAFCGGGVMYSLEYANELRAATKAAEQEAAVGLRDADWFCSQKSHFGEDEDVENYVPESGDDEALADGAPPDRAEKSTLFHAVRNDDMGALFALELDAGPEADCFAAVKPWFGNCIAPTTAPYHAVPPSMRFHCT